jgi:hypothetical protein
MGRINVVEYKGKRILVQDFSGARAGEEFDRSIAEAKAFIASQPAKSILSLFDATKAIYNTAVLTVLKEFTKHNEPYMKASAVVGVEGILSIALLAVSTFSGRTFKSFADRQSAMDWLAEQP